MDITTEYMETFKKDQKINFKDKFKGKNRKISLG
jgi:hypothetical protein